MLIETATMHAQAQDYRPAIVLYGANVATTSSLYISVRNAPSIEHMKYRA